MRERWDDHAARFALIGPPLRPSPDDVASAAAVVDAARPGARVLVLGVTPELCALVHDGTTIAADHHRGMLGSVWPGPWVVQDGAALCTDWLRPALRPASIDVVLGDACFTGLGFPDGQAALLAEIARLLVPGGACALRVLVRPGEPETPDDVLRTLAPAPRDTFSGFKLRLAMSLQRSSEEGVAVADVWDVWHETGLTPAAVATRTGWPLEEIATIDAWRDATARLAFPTLAEVRALAAPSLAERACRVGTYVLAERCPTLVWQREG